jgi:hypothetical protein
MNESTILEKESIKEKGEGGKVPGNWRVYSGPQLLSSPTARIGSSALNKRNIDVIAMGK